MIAMSWNMRTPPLAAVAAPVLICMVVMIGNVSSQGTTIVVTSEPRDQEGRLDQPTTVVFSITVIGGKGQLTFKWYLNDSMLLTSNQHPNDGLGVTDTYTADPSQSGGFYSLVGRYSCRVTDAQFPPNMAISRSASLEIVYIPTFLETPQNITANLTNVVQFTCRADALPIAAYQWKENGVDLSGETQTTLTVNITDTSYNGRRYTCEAGNRLSFVRSSAYLTVISRVPYFIAGLPHNVSVNYGTQHTLRCIAAGTPGVHYTWYEEDRHGAGSKVMLPGVDGTSLTISVTSNSKYSCEARNQLGVITSSISVFVIIVKPTVSYTVYNKRTYVGYPLSISCNVEGIPTPTVHWRFLQSGYNTVRILPSVSQNKYYKVVAEKSDQGFYTCVGTNVGGDTVGSRAIYVIVDNLQPDISFTATSMSSLVTIPGSSDTATMATPAATATGVQVVTSRSGVDGSSPVQSVSIDSEASSQAMASTKQTASSPSSTVDVENPSPSSASTGDPASASIPMNSTDVSSTNGQQSGDDKIVTIVVPVIVVILILGVTMVIVLLYVNHKRSLIGADTDQKPLASESKNAAKTLEETGGPEMEMDVITSTHPELSDGRRSSSTGSQTHDGMTLVGLTEVLTRVEAAISSGERTNELVAQYEDVPLNMVSLEHSPSTLGTEHKNRYMNVLPNVETAVHLAEDPVGDMVSTYINANYVQDYFGNEKAFIATQGPTADTVDDFWRMIWQDKVAVIVMATQIVERGRAKCMRYWPEGETSQVYGKLCVNVDDITDNPDYLLTTMSIFYVEDDEQAESKTSRTIRHFWFKGWPDFGIPMYTDPVLNFIDTIVEVNIDDAPIVVHCSAGIGRTGTLIAIKMGMQHFQHKKVVQPIKYLNTLRQCRGGCVQTFDQYLFVHRALMTFMSRENEQQQQQQVPEITDANAEADDHQPIEGDHSETKLL